jgi:hypothetical protein
VQVGRERDLEGPRIAGHHVDGHAGGGDERGVVGVLAVGARVRPCEARTREALRGLHGGEFGAIDGVEHAPRGIHPLDGVDHVQSGHDAVPACPHRGRHLVEHDRRRERPGRVVDEHRRHLVRQHGEPARDGFLPGGPARDDVERCGRRLGDGRVALARLVDPVGGHHEHHARRLLHAEHGIEGDAEDRVPAERHERLGLGVPEAGAAAGGDDDDGDGR